MLIWLNCGELQQPRNLMDSFVTSFFDFFLPRVCIACECKLTPGEDSICETCYSKIKIAELPFLESEYKRKFEEDKLINGFLSFFVFEESSPIRSILHGLKYDKKFRLGIFLGKLLAANLDEKIKEWKTDFIIPIPLHKLKKAERGFNQSFYIAKGLAKNLDINVKTNILKRRLFTATQTKLNAEERKENMKGAFTIKNAKIVNGKNIILLDDVITTGSTISECARVLKQYGVNDIYALSVGIAN